MRLLFAHDHRFQLGGDGKVYSAGPFPSEAWDRYLEHFEAVHVIARGGEPAATLKKLSRSDRPEVSFELLPSLSSLRQLIFLSRQLNGRLRSAVAAADAVVARLPSEVGLVAARHAEELGKPYAIEVVGCAWDVCVHHGALRARAYAPLALLRNQRAIAKAPLALYVTSSWLQKRYPTSGEQWSASNVSLRPLCRAEIDHRESRLAALARGQRPVLGTIASLTNRSKGIQTAFAAVSHLRKEGVELTYRVLGPGPTEPWRALARKLNISHLIHFDGTRRAGEEVWQWLDEIDIHLQPSFQEGLPRATIEAMNRGAACLGSTCGGIPELIAADRIHRAGDSRALAKSIRILCTDPAALADASIADRETATRFDPSRLQPRRREFYGKLRERAEMKPTRK